jgi:hypothetical protein
MMRAFSIITGVVLLFAANEVSAAEVAVFPTEGTNLSEEEETAIGVMIAQSYAIHTGKSVIDPRATRAVISESQNPKSAAQNLGVSQYITIKAVRLTTKISLIVSLYDEVGIRIYRTRVTATSLDDMEQVAERVSLSLYHRKPIDDTRTIHNVTVTETKPENRTWVEKVLGVKTMVVLPLAIDHSFDPYISAQFDGRWEQERYFLEFGAGFLLTPSVQSGDNTTRIGGLLAEVGGSYYLSTSNISPYIGGGILPRILFKRTGRRPSNSGANLALFGQTGLMFFRESSTRLYVDLRLAQNVIPWPTPNTDDCDDGYYSSDCEDMDTTKYYPLEVGLAVGIGW